MKKYICLAAILVLIFSSCSTEKEEPNAQSQYPEGSVFGANGPTKVVEVTNPKTGRTWMDRNLGATRAATSSTDVESYGDLYQWGRGADGHQLRNSGTTSMLSSTDIPGNGNFIAFASDASIISPGDWRKPQNNTLWQGINGINNPCPIGYRLPTEAEWIAEHQSWTNQNDTGAFASPLKLPKAGYRSTVKGSLGEGGGTYWSSTVSGNSTSVIGFGQSGANMAPRARAFGYSVRCIKN
jgi:uncharacterized protein (TIGR02145 family)